MATTVRKVGYFHTSVSDKPGEGARVLGTLRNSGINLLAFHAFPTGGGKSQLDVVPVDERAFQDAASKAKLELSERKTVFLVEGDDRPGAIAELLQKLSAAGANVTAMDAIKSGQQYGALIWVKAADADRAGKALAAT